MPPTTADWPEVELGDPPGSKPHRGRWTVGRVATDLALVAVAVPLGLSVLAPPVRGECGTTLGALAYHAGLIYFAARAAWVSLKAFNDAAELWLDRRARTAHDTPRRTPTP